MLDAADPTFDYLNASFPPTRAFAREILPGVRETAGHDRRRVPVDRPDPRAGVAGRAPGPGRATCSPAVADLSTVTDDTIELLPQVDLVNRCFTDIILPDRRRADRRRPLSTGIENYKEFWQTMTALSGESQNFDGNGPYTRFQTGGGRNTFSTGTRPARRRPQLFGNPAPAARHAPGAARPRSRRTTARRPATRTRRPNLNSAKIGGGP